MNVNEPESLVIFAQESGRAGRDGQRAYSWVLLPLDWKPQDEVTVACEGLVSSTRDIGLRKRRDKRSMHRYQRGEQCYRTSLSQYLDVEQHHRWCMQEDVPCDVCKIGHQEAMEPPKMTKTGIEHTGIDLIRQGRLKAYSELARYREDLSAVHGTCLLCRALDQKWDHAFSSCVGRYEVFQERSKARRRHQAKGEEWLRPFTACFWCLNPQAICQRAEGEDGRQKEGCEYKDVVLPLCFGVFQSPPGPSWLLEEFGRDFSNIEGFFDWLGEVSEFGGGSAIQAVRVAALALKRLRVK